LRTSSSNSSSLGSMVHSVAEHNATLPAFVSHSSITGCVFDDISLDEVEALLRVHKNARLDSTHLLSIKRVLVLGASGGIGRECVKELSTKKITTLAPSRGELDLVNEIEFSCLAGVDGVIHAAGAYATSAIEIMEVNFHSGVRLLKAAQNLGWTGSIVFLSSTASTFGRVGAPVYSASKAALNTLLEAESELLYRKGIRVNAVAPARVATSLQKRLNPDTPINAMISPAYVARTVVRTLFSPSHGSIIYLRKGQDI